MGTELETWSIAGKGPVGADEMMEEEGVKEEGDTKARSAGLHVTTSLPP